MRLPAIPPAAPSELRVLDHIESHHNSLRRAENTDTLDRGLQTLKRDFEQRRQTLQTTGDQVRRAALKTESELQRSITRLGAQLVKSNRRRAQKAAQLQNLQGRIDDQESRLDELEGKLGAVPSRLLKKQSEHLAAQAALAAAVEDDPFDPAIKELEKFANALDVVRQQLRPVVESSLQDWERANPSLAGVLTGPDARKTREALESILCWHTLEQQVLPDQVGARHTLDTLTGEALARKLELGLPAEPQLSAGQSVRLAFNALSWLALMFVLVQISKVRMQSRPDQHDILQALNWVQSSRALRSVMSDFGLDNVLSVWRRRVNQLDELDKALSHVGPGDISFGSLKQVVGLRQLILDQQHSFLPILDAPDLRGTLDKAVEKWVSQSQALNDGQSPPEKYTNQFRQLLEQEVSYLRLLSSDDSVQSANRLSAKLTQRGLEMFGLISLGVMAMGGLIRSLALVVGDASRLLEAKRIRRQRAAVRGVGANLIEATRSAMAVESRRLALSGPTRALLCEHRTRQSAIERGPTSAMRVLDEYRENLEVRLIESLRPYRQRLSTTAEDIARLASEQEALTRHITQMRSRLQDTLTARDNLIGEIDALHLELGLEAAHHPQLASLMTQLTAHWQAQLDHYEQTRRNDADYIAGLSTIREQYQQKISEQHIARAKIEALEKSPQYQATKAQAQRHITQEAFRRARQRHTGLTASNLQKRVRGEPFENHAGEITHTDATDYASSYYTEAHLLRAILDVAAQAAPVQLADVQALRVKHASPVGEAVSAKRPETVLKAAASQATLRSDGRGGFRIAHLHPVP